MAEEVRAPNRQAGVALIRRLAHARRLFITGKAQQDMETAEYDADDVCECLSQVDVVDVHKDEPDENVSDRRVFVFRRTLAGQELYVKVSLRLERDHDLTVLSFKRWGKIGRAHV